MKQNFLLLSFLTIILTSCEFKCSMGNTSDDAATKKNSTSSSSSSGDYTDGVNKSQVMNDIDIKATGGVKVYRAFLGDESGSVKKENTAKLGEPIFIYINVESGWKEVDGKSYIGASEIITTDGGIEVLNSGDLFKSLDESGASPDDAKFVNLRARITQPASDVKSYIVKFRVWDKKGEGEITGSYKFSLSDEIPAR